MKKKRNKIPLDILSAREETNKYNIILWWAFLTAIMTIGIRMIIGETWGSLNPGKTGSILIFAAGIVACAGSEVVKKRSVYGNLLLLLPWPLLLTIGGIPAIARGSKLWINVLISRWNTLHEGGVALFNVQTDAHAVAALTAFVFLISVEIFWFIVSGQHIILGNLIFLFWMLVQLISGVLNPLGCGFLLAGMAGVWITEKKSLPALRQIIWTLAIFGIATALALFVPSEELLSIHDMRETVKDEIHRIRYGEDTLPEGNLYDAAGLKASDKEMLKVETKQNKNIYLRGYTGAVYRNGVWENQPDSVYGGARSGMLKWLQERGFDPLSQVAEYYNCDTNGNAPDKNTVHVQTTGASRYYVYAPSSLKEITEGKTKEKKDTEILGKGMFGTDEYQLDEVSTSRPGELTVADSWVSSPETDEQKAYTETEAVYRSFVYETYRSVDKETKDLIQQMFWDDYKTESDGIYSAITWIRNVLQKNVQYTDYPNDVPDGEDPVRWFLTGSKKGNAMLYASAAVDALRVHGIPARYVEGYYISSADAEEADGTAISVTGQDAHAWTEAYFDGIGWLPLDVTPGYYYDAVTLQKMVSSPDVVQKNATLKDNSYGAEEVTGMEGEQKKSIGRKVLPVVRDIGALCLGIVGLLLILLVFGIIICEIVRAYCIWHTEKVYKTATHEERVRRTEKAIYSWMSLVGIEAHLGWNTEETDRILSERFPEVEEGEYSRVCELIEKVIYGGIELEPYEIRTLNSFFAKLTEIGHTGSLRYRLILRYAFAWKNRK